VGITKMKMTVGAMLGMLKSDLYPDPDEAVEGLALKDGTHPTVSEAIKLLADIDPETYLNDDKEKEDE